MEKLYIFSELSMWESDLLLQEYPQVPSQEVIDTIIEYSQSKEYFSPTLEKTILISVN